MLLLSRALFYSLYPDYMPSVIRNAKRRKERGEGGGRTIYYCAIVRGRRRGKYLNLLSSDRHGTAPRPLSYYDLDGGMANQT